MHNIAKLVVLILACLIPAISSGEECTVLKSGKIADATEYLRRAAEKQPVSLSCVQLAFEQIAGAPSEQAVPILIDYLGYKRTLNSGEGRGIFLHGNTPGTLYPAIHALYTIGPPAEPGLISFVAHSKEQGGVEQNNALYTLLLIHHGDAMSVIGNLMKESKSSSDTEDRTRLRAAATNVAAKWCDEQAKEKCEDALK